MNKEGIMEDDRKGTWEEITRECEIDWGSGEKLPTNIRVQHNGDTIAYIGGKCTQQLSCTEDYRVTAPSQNTGLQAGAIKVEHFIPDPEPVIAYKAVRVDEDGVMRSILCGATDANYMSDGRQLDYEIGQNVDGGQYGVFCFSTVEIVKDAYITGYMARSRRPLAILKVEACGKPIDTSELKGIPTNHDIISYPSVKVLSVAWEEEKKEEWVDITAECHLAFKEHESGHYIRIGYDGELEDEALGYVGEKVEMNYPSKYRITAHPRKVDRGGLDSGCIKVEKRND